MKKLLMIIIVAVVLGGLGYGIYDSVKPKEKYEIKLWNNIYNGDSIALFYEEESDLRIEMLRALYNLDKIDKGDDEINYILKVSEVASKVVTLDNVDDTKALNGYDIIRLIGEKRIVSAKDMAIIVRDFITSVGYDARIGEIRCRYATTNPESVNSDLKEEFSKNRSFAEFYEKFCDEIEL